MRLFVYSLSNTFSLGLLFWPLLALAGVVGYVIVSKKQGKPLSMPYLALLVLGFVVLTAAIILLL